MNDKELCFTGFLLIAMLSILAFHQNLELQERVVVLETRSEMSLNQEKLEEKIKQLQKEIEYLQWITKNEK